MRVLIVEDDGPTAQALELMLKSEKFKTYCTDSGEDAVSIGKLYEYDCILLDIGLPDISGIEVLGRLRSAKIRTPVIIVSGYIDMDWKLNAFRLGADDYVTKPFHKDELLARMYAVVRRHNGHVQNKITVGDLTVDIDRKMVELNGSSIHLTGKEYAMIELLALRKGTTLTKENFLNHLYGGRDEPEAKIIDVFICKLRRKIARASAGKNYIETVWGRGYVLRDEQEAA